LEGRGIKVLDWGLWFESGILGIKENFDFWLWFTRQWEWMSHGQHISRWIRGEAVIRTFTNCSSAAWSKRGEWASSPTILPRLGTVGCMIPGVNCYAWNQFRNRKSHLSDVMSSDFIGK
jgi:hypothetical protein